MTWYHNLIRSKWPGLDMQVYFCLFAKTYTYWLIQSFKIESYQELEKNAHCNLLAQYLNYLWLITYWSAMIILIIVIQLLWIIFVKVFYKKSLLLLGKTLLTFYPKIADFNNFHGPSLLSCKKTELNLKSPLFQLVTGQKDHWLIKTKDFGEALSFRPVEKKYTLQEILDIVDCLNNCIKYSAVLI